MKRNILALYIIKLSKWFTLVMPIIVLFYEDHGLGLQDVFILKSVYSIAAVALAFNLTYAGLAILFVFYIIRGFATPILKGYINQMTFSEMRATVLSIRNFIIRLMFAAIAPFIGWLNDVYSLRIALLASAAIIMVPGALFLWLQLMAKTDKE